MPAPTLLAMAQRNLTRNISSLQDVGDAPYEVVKPALRKIVDPQQLRNIELVSPHIADSDSELWLAFIKRDILNWEKKLITPKNPRSWSKVYQKMWREEKAAQEEQAKQLADAMAKQRKEKEDKQPMFLNTTVQQRVKQGVLLDGVINPNAGKYGHERVGSVNEARKKGKSIVAALRKASSTKTSHFTPPKRTFDPNPKPPGKMWQSAPTNAPGKRKNPPNALLNTGPRSHKETFDKNALDRAMKKDAQMKEEKAKKASMSPPPSTSGNRRTHASSPPKAAATAPKPANNTRPTTDAIATAHTAPQQRPVATLGSGAGSKRPLSPEKASPAPPQKRARPATSIFMPQKKRINR